MNIFKNKFFLLGNLAFLLLVIPVVLFFVKNQTSTRGSAAPTTTISFTDPPTITTDQCDATKTSKLVLNPSQNLVSTVALALKWDRDKFDIEFTPNRTAFPQIMKEFELTPTGATITLNIGGDTNQAIATTTDLGTVTIKPKAPTNGTVINLEIDPIETKVYSLFRAQDGVGENVFNPTGSSPLQISILPKVCDAQVSPSPSTSQTAPTATPTTLPGTSTPTPTTVSSIVATPTTAAANPAPVCVSLNASTSSGSAPLSVTLTAAGTDSNGTISKVTFNFGNGTQQDVTTGLGTASASAQLTHTYTSGGNFTATAVFTDNSGSVSLTCSKLIAVSGAFATTAPTVTPTIAPTGVGATNTPTNTPTIAASGSFGTTVGIVAGIILVIVTGFFLLAL